MIYDAGIYDGELMNATHGETPHGRGTWTLTNTKEVQQVMRECNNSYHGEWVGGVKQGLGIYVDCDGNSYKGEVRN